MSLKPVSPGRFAAWFITVSVVVFLIAPIFIIVVASFGEGTYLSFPPKDYGLEYYHQLLNDSSWIHSLQVSALIAGIATAVAVPVGLLAAVALVRGRFRGKTLVLGLVLSPMIVPSVVSTLAIFLLLDKLGLFGNVIAIAVAEAVLILPLVIVILTASLQSLDVRLEDAAVSLGASRVKAFCMVGLPSALPGIVSATLFSLLLSFDELMIPLFMAQPGNEPLAVKIFSALEVNVDPIVAAVSTPLILASVLVFAAGRIVQRRERKQARV